MDDSARAWSSRSSALKLLALLILVYLRFAYLGDYRDRKKDTQCWPKSRVKQRVGLRRRARRHIQKHGLRETSTKDFSERRKKTKSRQCDFRASRKGHPISGSFRPRSKRASINDHQQVCRIRHRARIVRFEKGDETCHCGDIIAQWHCSHIRESFEVMFIGTWIHMDPARYQ